MTGRDAMTTAQHMLAFPRVRRLSRRLAAFVALAPLALSACTSSAPEFVAPRTLTAPAYAAPGGPEVLWVVAPLRNESGVGAAPAEMVTDALIEQIEQVDGLAAVPLNRTLAAMRSLELPFIGTPDEALALAQTLGADAIVVGSITSWNPYEPPKIGLALALFVTPGSAMAGPGAAAAAESGPPDPVLLQSAPTEMTLPGAQWAAGPGSVVSEQLDGASHGVQMAVKDFAEGRSPTVSALGWRRYLASMPLYAEFACFHLTERLLMAERQRIAGWSGEEQGR